MVPLPCLRTSPVPPPAYHRMQAKIGPALHLDALTLITRLQLLALCRLAVRLARRRCSSPVLAGAGGRPRVYAEESLLLLALLHTLWRLSYQDLHDWLVDWPALARAQSRPTMQTGAKGGSAYVRDAVCTARLPCLPCPSPQRTRRHHRQCTNPGMAPGRPGRRRRARAAPSRSPAPTRLPRPPSTLSRVGIAPAVPALARQRPRCAVCSPTLGGSCGALRSAPTCRAP